MGTGQDERYEKIVHLYKEKMERHDETSNDEIIALMMKNDEEELKTKSWMNKNKKEVERAKVVEKSLQKKINQEFEQEKKNENKKKQEEEKEKEKIKQERKAELSITEGLLEMCKDPQNDPNTVLSGLTPSTRFAIKKHIRDTQKNNRPPTVNQKIKLDSSRRYIKPPKVQNPIRHVEVPRIPRVQIQNHSNEDFSYERLLELDKKNYDIGNGLSQEKIALLPISFYKESKNCLKEPCFCSEKYAKNERICHLPCFHMFHADCIKNWLLRKKTCPICKSDIEL